MSRRKTPYAPSAAQCRLLAELLAGRDLWLTGTDRYFLFNWRGIGSYIPRATVTRLRVEGLLDVSSAKPKNSWERRGRRRIFLTPRGRRIAKALAAANAIVNDGKGRP